MLSITFFFFISLEMVSGISRSTTFSLRLTDLYLPGHFLLPFWMTGVTFAVFASQEAPLIITAFPFQRELRLASQVWYYHNICFSELCHNRRELSVLYRLQLFSLCYLLFDFRQYFQYFLM